MKSFATAAVIAASVFVNVATAQVSCPAASNSSFCEGGSLSTNIILRCTNGVGQPGNCDDNLAGEPPLGVNYSPCWQTSATSGDAACSKNCIVYASNGTFTLPASECTPSSSSSSSSGSSPSTSSSAAASTSTSTYVLPSGTGTGGSSSVAGNGTFSTATYTSTSSPTATPVGPTTTSGSASSSPTGFTGSAVANSAGSVLAAFGLVVAYFL